MISRGKSRDNSKGRKQFNIAKQGFCIKNDINCPPINKKFILKQ